MTSIRSRLAVDAKARIKDDERQDAIEEYVGLQGQWHCRSGHVWCSNMYIHMHRDLNFAVCKAFFEGENMVALQPTHAVEMVWMNVAGKRMKAI